MNWIAAQHNALSKLIQPDWHYADVGACVGEMSDFLSARMKMGHLFEPSQKNYEYLTQKYSSLREDQITINNCAVSKYNGVSNFSLNVDDSHTGNLEGSLPESQIIIFEEQITKVKTINLDTYFKNKKIDLIKIDTEGAEWDILEGAREIMTKNSITLQIEFHWDEDWHRKRILEEMGYKIYDLNFNKISHSAPRPYQGIVSKKDF